MDLKVGERDPSDTSHLHVVDYAHQLVQQSKHQKFSKEAKFWVLRCEQRISCGGRICILIMKNLDIIDCQSRSRNMNQSSNHG